jgi:Tfp pilus assembly protein PilO
MRIGHADRLWVTGGAFGAAVLLAIGWFLFIGPRNAETSSLEQQTVAAEVHVASLTHRLAELRQQNRNLPKYKAQLERDRQALPTTAGMADFLRELQAAGENAGVSVQGILVGAPIQATAPASEIIALPITLTAAGTTAKLDLFLDQLQKVQPRAVLISSANAMANEQDGNTTLSLTLQAFVAPSTPAPSTAATG